LATSGFAQTGFAPIHSEAAYQGNRLSLQNGGDIEFHPEVRNFLRSDLFKIGYNTGYTNPIDSNSLVYLLNENSEWESEPNPSRRPILKHFFKTPANLFEVRTKDFQLLVNPMLHLGYGSDSGKPLFVNERGLSIRGSIDNKVYFHTSLLETQIQPPAYAADWISEKKAIPGAGFYKVYRSKVFDLDRAYDYNVANAALGAQITPHIGVEIGHGQHFIGNGHRSLFLSDFGSYYFYLKFNTRIWKLQYQNLFMELSPVSQAVVGNNDLLPKKYAAVHYLHYNITPRIGVGFFEATVFNRSRQFELQYLNPIILYRSVEGLIGSPDNVLVGVDFRWDIARKVRLYSQLLLDEFRLSDLYKPEQTGWWGNKYGIQTGVQYINAFNINQLDLRAEYNLMRPYTYSHFDSLNSYQHYNQALAHPLGANFKELFLEARKQILPQWSARVHYLHIQQGLNSPDANWGADPTLPYTSRIQEYGNVIGQGLSNQVQLLGMQVSYSPAHNAYIDLRFQWRKQESDSGSFIQLGLRYNVWPQNFDF
jgi:hypothetical protein